MPLGESLEHAFREVGRNPRARILDPQHGGVGLALDFNRHRAAGWRVLACVVQQAGDEQFQASFVGFNPCGNMLRAHRQMRTPPCILKPVEHPRGHLREVEPRFAQEASDTRDARVVLVREDHAG